MGPDWARLPDPVRAVHDGAGEARLACRVTIRPSPRWMGRALARLAGLPSRAAVREGELRIRRAAGGEVWERLFGSDRITSRQWDEGGRLVEAFGPLQLVFALRADAQGLHFDQVRARLGWGSFRVALPSALAPLVRARVWADGLPHAQVTVTARGLGMLCAYEGVVIADPPA